MLFFQKPTPSLKTITVIFASIFVISSSYLLSKNLSFHSLKISYYYLLAKFYTVVGIENFNINISGSFGAIFTRKAVDVISNFYVVEIFNDTLKTLWISILTGLFWAMFLLVILVLLFGIKIWWESDRRRWFNFWKMKKIIAIQKRQPIYHQKPGVNKHLNLTHHVRPILTHLLH